jgi:hypothetical protein
MSNYTLAVNWSGKDALSDSDAAKVISGSDFNSEFTTVQTAINSKANLNGAAGESFAIDDATVAGTLTIGETLAVTGNTTLSTLTVSGVPTIPTAATATNTTQAASTAMVQAAIDADVTVHAALRSSQTVFGHAKIWTSGGDLYIATA